MNVFEATLIEENLYIYINKAEKIKWDAPVFDIKSIE
jgi:hypothetical protein